MLQPTSYVAPALTLIVGVMLFAGLHHLLIGLRRPHERVYLTFAAVSLLAACWTAWGIPLYAARTPEAFLHATRWRQVMGLGIGVSLLWFIAEYTSVRPRVFLWSLTGVQLAMAVAAVSLPFTLYFSGPPQLEHPLMRWGEVITTATLPEGPLLLPTEIVTTLNFLFGLWASGVMWLRGQRRGAVPLLVVLALILVGLWHPPLPGLGDVPTAELDFVGLVLVMSLVVSNRVVEAAVVKEALAESEQRLRTLVETAPEAVLLLNSASGVALEANDSALELFGEERASLPRLHPASAAPVEQEDGEPSMLVFERRMREAAQGGRPTFRWIVRGRPGGDVPCEARLVRLPGTEPSMTRLSLTDVRELEAAEARQSQLEAQLLRSQRLEALGRLTGGVAHDFNNFLTAIGGNLQLLVEDNPLPPESRMLVDEALRAVDRSAELTRRLLAFSRGQALEARPIQLGKLVGNVVGLLERTLGERVVIEVELQQGLRTFAADSVQLESALVNLAINAYDAMPEGGRIRLEARNVDVDAVGNGWGEPAPEGRYVGIAVRDDGTGMQPEVLRHAVEPFFTTKPAGKGTGLGLSTVYGFVTQSGGAMHVESAPGEGTCVELLFPAIPG
ncbi:MAG: PAS domain-containing protein [Gemmatimonadetes bacterium]|nr:PAS domain-containing protein [Gemmatimonadota bacterium]